MNEKRDKLVWNAIPTTFPDIPNPPPQLISQRKPPTMRSNAILTLEEEKCHVQIPVIDHSYTSSPKMIQQEPSDIKLNSRVLTNKIVQLQTELSLVHQISKADYNLSAGQIVQAAVTLGMKPTTAKFFEGQLRNCNRKEKGFRWTVKEKAMALGIYFRSRKAYQTLCALFVMPSASTLNRYVSSIPSTTGVSKQIVALMKMKVANMSDISRHCVVTFDEMSLKKELKYHPARDEIYGLVELPERLPTPCKQALVFMIRGLAENWKQPFAFFFSENAASAKHLHRLLMEVLEAVCSTNLKPVAVVCDQGSCNRMLYRNLNINVEKPYFMTASWKDVENFFKFDTSLPVRLAPKLTTKHIFLPPFSPMRVNLAAQVCSHTVYAGMHTLVSLEKLAPSAATTANFLKQVNDVFDFLNVRTIRENSTSRPITASEVDIGKLQSFKQAVAKWRVKRNNKLIVQPCFEALLLSLNGIDMLSQELIADDNFKFILSGRINQDCLENFFSQVRAKGGHRFNPSAVEFIYAYRSLSCKMFLTPMSTANCINDQDSLLVSLNSLAARSDRNKRKRKPEQELDVADERASKVPRLLEDVATEDSVTVTDFSVTLAVENVLCYVAGYVVNKLKINGKCSDCFNKLTISDNVVSDSNLFCHFKVYKHKAGTAFGPLAAPSQSLISMFKRLEIIFERNIQMIISNNGVLAFLIERVQSLVPLRMLELCDQHSDSATKFSTFKALIQLYLRCRLHYFCKFQSRKLEQKKCKKSRKASVVMHK